MKTGIHLSDHFTYSKLLRFTLPSIVMNIFSSLYIIVDGFFVANFAGKTEFAAVNLIMPVLNILGTIGYMFGVGGSALIAKRLGEKDQMQANQLFSLIVFVSCCLGILLMVPGFIFMPQITSMLGAEGKLLEDSVLYGRIFILALPAWIWVYEFQLFFVNCRRCSSFGTDSGSGRCFSAVLLWAEEQQHPQACEACMGWTGTHQKLHKRDIGIHGRSCNVFCRDHLQYSAS